MTTSYAIVDAEARNAEHPATFRIPHPNTIAAVRPGDLVKLAFEFTQPVPDDMPAGERMWVEVAAIDGNRWTGILRNQPDLVPLEYGQVIEFAPANILNTHIMPSADREALTDAILQDEADSWN